MRSNFVSCSLLNIVTEIVKEINLFLNLKMIPYSQKMRSLYLLYAVHQLHTTLLELVENNMHQWLKKEN